MSRCPKPNAGGLLKVRRWPCVALIVWIVACNRAPAKSPFVAVADVRQLMASVIEPSADVYWDAVGSVEDSTGLTVHYPQTTEAWDAVRNSAYVVAEAGNLLLIEPRLRDHDEWVTLSQAMIDAGKRAIKAAEAKDTAAVFNAGAELYDACTSCHSRYVVGQRPPDAK